MRVVMLVDNGVKGDSRVQKAAQSAAEAGWEVILLGCSPDGQPHSWKVGQAEVRLLPMPRRGPSAIGQSIRRWDWLRSVARHVRRHYWDRAYAWYWVKKEGAQAWRRLDPALWDYELAFSKEIDALQPDLIHANDFRMLGVGARAKERNPKIKLVWDAHEYLPGLVSYSGSARWLEAQCSHERLYAPRADAVVTVSQPLAQLLKDEHGLAEMPAVVLNAPDATEGDEKSNLRELCGVDEQTPLIVYSGGVTPVRGVEVMIDGLARLPHTHIALVSLAPGKTPEGHLAVVLARAEKLGVANRVHLLTHVPHWQVPSFLAPADAAVSPLLHLANHEIALSNKFFEYAQARLPIITSDIRTMAETVQTIGLGEVFRAANVDDYVRAVNLVLADPAKYRAAYDRPGLLEGWTWAAQAKVLNEVYTRMLG